MTGGEDYPRSIFDLARNEEKKYRWLKASQTYSDLLSSDQLSRSARAETFRLMGRANFQASFQTIRPETFRENIRKAIVSFRKARAMFSGTGRNDEALRVHCLAMEAYLRFWIARNPSAKKKFVSSSWTLAKRAMKRFDRMKDPVGFAETFDLISPGVPVALNYEWDPSRRTTLYDEALEFGRRAIEMLSDDPVNKDLLARICVRTALFIDASREELGQVRDQDRLDEEGRNYWEEATRISEEHALLALSRPPEGFANIIHPDEYERIWEKAFKIATKSRDRFSIGWLCDRKATLVFWQAQRTHDVRRSTKLSERSLKLAEKARAAYECCNFVSYAADILWPNSPYAEHFLQLSWFQIDPEKHRMLATKSVKEAGELLKIAKASSYPIALSYGHHVVAHAETELAEFETNPIRKRRLIDEALRHRSASSVIHDKVQPRSLWLRGGAQSGLAEVKRSLSELEADPREKRRWILEAIENKAQGLELSKRYVDSISRGKSHFLHGALARYSGNFGHILVLASETLGDEKHLLAAANAFTEAVAFCRKSGTSKRGVGVFSWMAARTHDRLGDYSTAAGEFLVASKVFRKVARKSELGPLLRDRARYLVAWSLIEKARECHSRLEYEQASRIYRKVATTCRSTHRWKPLAPYYKSMAQLEHAEALSKLGENTESIQAFEEAAILSERSPVFPESMPVERERPGERILTEKLAGEPIAKYCRARILIEEANKAQNRGDYRTGSQKFADASEKLYRMSKDLQTVEEQREVLFLASLSEGWGLITRGIGMNSRELLEQAYDKFEKTEAIGYNRSSRLLARAYNLYSKGIQSANEFAKTSERPDYEDGVKCLTMALDCFLRSGFTVAYQQADAARRFLEAQFQISEASKENDQTKKAALLEMGATLLGSAADLFEKAHQPAAREEATRLIERLREDQFVSSNLAEVSRAVSNRLGAFAIPAPTRWGGAVTDFVGAQGVDIEASLKIETRNHAAGDDLKVVVEIANVGTKNIRIVSLEKLVPEGVSIVDYPRSSSRVQGRSLTTEGMTMAPASIERLPIVLRAKSQGFVLIRPRLVFHDDAGKQFEMDLQPRILASSKVLEFLSQEFTRDYTVKHLAPAHAGWRTFMEIVSSLKISRNRLYGDPRRGRQYGKEIEALMKAGLVEVRVFPGERGRGGNIIKARLAYDNIAAQQFVESMKSATLETST